MGYKELLNQWWMLKEVKRKDGKRKRNEEIYQNKQPYCFGLRLIYWLEGSTALHFDYFMVDGSYIEENWWRTSVIESIEETDTVMSVTTRNTYYTFERLDYNPLQIEVPERMN